jgi:hypothetical protein
VNFLTKTILLSITVVSCCCAARPSKSGMAMIAHEIRVGSEIYRFSVPVGESKDFPLQKVFVAFDFPPNSDMYRRDGFSLMHKFWDYRNGAIGINKDGTLDFQFRVRQFDREFKYEQKKPDAIQKYLLDDLSRAYEKLNAGYLKNGHDQLVVKLPEKINLTELAGKTAFSYRLGGGSDFDAYIIPVSEKYFVQIQFNFIDNSLGRGMEWRKKAQADADMIRSSMRIMAH